MWIATDKNGAVYGYQNKPERNEEMGGWASCSGGLINFRDWAVRELNIPVLKWEDEPIEWSSLSFSKDEISALHSVAAISMFKYQKGSAIRESVDSASCKLFDVLKHNLIKEDLEMNYTINYNNIHNIDFNYVDNQQVDDKETYFNIIIELVKGIMNFRHDGNCVVGSALVNRKVMTDERWKAVHKRWVEEDRKLYTLWLKYKDFGNLI